MTIIKMIAILCSLITATKVFSQELQPQPDFRGPVDTFEIGFADFESEMFLDSANSTSTCPAEIFISSSEEGNRVEISNLEVFETFYVFDNPVQDRSQGEIGDTVNVLDLDSLALKQFDVKRKLGFFKDYELVTDLRIDLTAGEIRLMMFEQGTWQQTCTYELN